MTDRPRHVHVRRAVMLAAMLAVLVGAGGAPAPTRIKNIYEVSGVKVDATAETAAKAREQALAEGEKEAFRRLLRRVTLIGDIGRLPQPAPEELAAYVSDFAVEDEKTSATRYLATLSFRFKSDAVRRLLIDHALPFTETASKPVLVLPVYEAAGALLLWDDPNPWRRAWQERSRADTLVPMLLAVGDMPDMLAIGAEQAVDGDPQRLAAIAKRYRVGDTIVAHAILRTDTGRPLPDLDVYVTRYGTALQEQTVVESFASASDEGVAELLARAVEQLSSHVEDNWKRDNLLRFGRPAVIVVTVPIGGLGDWLVVRERLGKIAVIRRSDMVLLSRDEVRVNLHYLGDPAQLALALEQADLVLSQEGDSWILGVARPSVPGEIKGSG